MAAYGQSRGNEDVSNSVLPAVVITGASTGIGKAVAIIMAKEGWLVYGTVRKQADAQALEASTPVAAKHRIRALICDVRNDEQMKAAAARVKEDRGQAGLQALVNNAGRVSMAPLEFFPLEEFNDIMQTNVIGTLRATQVFLPLLRQGRAGGYRPRIANVSSVAGSLPLPFWGAYSSSKGAMDSMNDSLRYELVGQGIDVMLLKPGAVKTPIWSRGAAATELVMSGMPANFDALYGNLAKRMEATVAQMEKDGIEVEPMAQAVRTALTARYAYPTTFQPFQSWVLHMLRQLTPTPLWDFLVFPAMFKTWSWASGGPAPDAKTS